MVKLAKWELNRKESGVDAKKEELEKDQVRFEPGFVEGFGPATIMVVYEDKSGRASGIVNKKVIMDIIELEQKMTSWDNTSENFRNKKFNNNARVAWKDMCFAGLDAPIDPRTNKAKCLKNQAYISAVGLFEDNWKDCFRNPLCNNSNLIFATPAKKAAGKHGLGGLAKLAEIEAGSKKDEDKAFRDFFEASIEESDVVRLLQYNMGQPAWASAQ